MELFAPVDIITDILSRLPVLTLMQCKSVCKSWRAIIDDPTFVDNYTLQHEKHEEEGFLFYTTNCHGNDQGFHYGEYNYKDTSFKLCQLINHHDFTNKPIVVGSCKGLICLRSSWNPYSMCIYNPITGEYMNLPNLRYISDQCVASGFGYHPITKQYKVVAIFFNKFGSSEHVVYVYTLGSDHWRIKGITRCSLGCVKPRGTQVNGALYWMNMMTEIITFDMASEELRMILLPQPLKTHLQSGYDYRDLELGVLGGYLCIIEQNYTCQCSYVYVMNSKDYSWTMKSSIGWQGPYNNAYPNGPNTRNDYIFKKLAGKLKPVALSIHGKIWLQCSNPGTVEFYDLRTKVLHLIKILKEDMQCPKYIEIIPFTKSYVSLTGFFGKEDWTTRQGSGRVIDNV